MANKTCDTLCFSFYLILIYFQTINCVYYYYDDYDDYMLQNFKANDIDYFKPKEDISTGFNKELSVKSLHSLEDKDSGRPHMRARNINTQNINERKASGFYVGKEHSAAYYFDPLEVRIGSSSASIAENMAETRIGSSLSAGVGDHFTLSDDESGAGARVDNVHAYANQNNKVGTQIEDFLENHFEGNSFGDLSGDNFEKIFNSDPSNDWLGNNESVLRNYGAPIHGTVGKDLKYEDLTPELKAQVDAARAKSKAPKVSEGREGVEYGDDTQIIAVEQEEETKEKKYRRDYQKEEYEKRITKAKPKKSPGNKKPQNKSQIKKPKNYFKDPDQTTLEMFDRRGRYRYGRPRLRRSKYERQFRRDNNNFKQSTYFNHHHGQLDRDSNYKRYWYDLDNDYYN